jgi:hypothetical protein
MNKAFANKSRGRTVRVEVDALPRRGAKHMTALKRRSKMVDNRGTPVGDLAEGRWFVGGHRVPGLRGAIIREINRRGITRYQFWKLARALNSKIPGAAVYEYLDGRRQVGANYLEAMLSAVDLEARPRASA